MGANLSRVMRLIQSMGRLIVVRAMPIGRLCLAFLSRSSSLHVEPVVIASWMVSLFGGHGDPAAAHGLGIRNPKPYRCLNWMKTISLWRPSFQSRIPLFNDHFSVGRRILCIVPFIPVCWACSGWPPPPRRKVSKRNRPTASRRQGKMRPTGSRSLKKATIRWLRRKPCKSWQTGPGGAYRPLPALKKIADDAQLVAVQQAGRHDDLLASTPRPTFRRPSCSTA